MMACPKKIDMYMVFFILIYSTVCLILVNGFIPNHTGRWSDYTSTSQSHKQMMDTAVRQVAVQFMNDFPSIYPDHEAAMSTADFKTALKNFVKAVAKPDTEPAMSGLPEAHFDGEEIVAANTRLLEERVKVLMALDGNEMSGARDVAGQLLHTLQDFYSHSNWLELGNTELNSALGSPGQEGDIGKVARLDEPTCVNCDSDTCYKMTENLENYLRKRGLKEDIIEKFRDEKIDEDTVSSMTDDELKAVGLSKFGDRVAIRSYAAAIKTNRKGIDNNITSESLLGKLKVRINSPWQTLKGNHNAKKSMRKVEVGWMMSNLARVYQVRGRTGGGTRDCSIDIRLTVEDLQREALNFFFPNGQSLHHGPLEDYSYHMTNFDSSHLPLDQTIQSTIERNHMSKLRVYLLTEKIIPDIAESTCKSRARKKKKSDIDELGSQQDSLGAGPSSDARELPLVTSLIATTATGNGNTDATNEIPVNDSEKDHSSDMLQELLPDLQDISDGPFMDAQWASTSTAVTCVTSNNQQASTDQQSSTDEQANTRCAAIACPRSSNISAENENLWLENIHNNSLPADARPEMVQPDTPTVQFRDRCANDIGNSGVSSPSDGGNTCSESVLTTKIVIASLVDDANAKSDPSEKKNVVNVVRDDLLPGVLRAFTRVTWRAENKLSVRFAGELGMDGGGLTREFLRLALKALAESSLFIGDPEKKLLNYSVKALDDKRYLAAGRLMAYSIVHGGPTPNFLDQVLYRFLHEGYSEDWPNYTLPHVFQAHMSKLENSEQDEYHSALEPFLETIEVAGLSSLVPVKKEMIPKLKKFLSYERMKDAFDQFVEGLSVLHILFNIREHPGLMRSCFVHENEAILSAEIMAEIFPVLEYAPEGSNLRRKQSVAHSFWLDLLQDFEVEYMEEDANDEDQKENCLHSLLVFATGADRIPILGFTHQPRILFKDDEDNLTSEYPSASTCDPPTLRLPIVHHEYNVFKSRFLAAMSVKSFTME